MEDGFTGVPDRDWRDLTARTDRLAALVALLFCLLLLLILTLLERGILSSVLDLFTVTRRG